MLTFRRRTSGQPGTTGLLPQGLQLPGGFSSLGSPSARGWYVLESSCLGLDALPFSTFPLVQLQWAGTARTVPKGEADGK